MGRNTLKLSTEGFEQYLAKLKGLGADLKPIVTEALEQAGETVQYDTENAMGSLPNGGKYETGKTRKSIIRNPEVKWTGAMAEIGVGFNFAPSSAAGYLITGTPRMKPARELNRMYKGKIYIKGIQQDMADIFVDELTKRMVD